CLRFYIHSPKQEPGFPPSQLLSCSSNKIAFYNLSLTLARFRFR
ncbi:hypothetical protein AVDCRST_MAG81-1944, partial [uncultured Synechococcales cyanobacterium]